MHIPDGYLSPATCGIFFAVMIPIWGLAARIVKKTLKARQVPLLAMGAAFSFVLMLFNIPFPGGSVGHPAGAVLIAILLGPWAGCVAVTVTVLIQAFLFGDGGITTLGANCFNMAFAMVFTGYYSYKLLSFKATTSSNRRIIAAGLAGYIGINVSAFLTGLEIGLQKSFYSPYGIRVTVPVMCIGYLLFFGWIEAVITALIVKYLKKGDNLEIQNP